MITIRSVGTSHEDFLRYQSLFDETFGPQRKFQPDVLKWLYESNPAGPVIGFDAFDEDLLVAHYVCVPVDISYEGRPERGLLSLNTVTKASHQGKGLFIKLAEATFQKASADGFTFVIGIANANSTPGFLRKLGFNLLESLSARIEISFLIGYDPTAAYRSASFLRLWDEDTLRWRMNNPANPLWCESIHNPLKIFGKALGKYLPVYTSVPSITNVGLSVRKKISPVSMFLGLIPNQSKKLSLGFDIPKFLRPSPLNFIYKDLSGKDRKIERGSAFISFLDFDAY